MVALFGATATSIFSVRADTQESGARSVLRLIAQRDFSSAVLKLDSGLESNPDDVGLIALSSMVRLCQGNPKGSLELCEAASSHMPNESLFKYGAAVSEIALNNFSAATALLYATEQDGGDVDAIRIARRYIDLLRSGKGDAGKPVTAVEFAIEGFKAARSGHTLHAIELLKSAVNGAEGDPFQQCAGPLLTFETAQPLQASLAPAKQLKRSASERTLSGEIPISPDEIAPGSSYAAYELDGGPLSIVGSRPYSYVWDTRRASNGRHKISIVQYDAGGSEVVRFERVVTVYNFRSGGSGPSSTNDPSLRADLWKALTPKPDRAACGYALATAYLAVGEMQQARVWFTRVAAIQSDYKDVFARLKSVGALRTAGTTLVSGRSTEKCIALTFDDGPKPGVTEPLLDLLKSSNVAATFFVIGRHIQEFPELSKSIATNGFEIDNHSYTHRSLVSLSKQEAVREMLQTQAAVYAITGKLPKYVRPPGGNWNNAVAADARKWGLTPCMWSVDVFDSEIIGAQKIIETVLKQVKPGSIVLMHNGKVSTLQALPTIIRELRAKGYTFVTVEALARKMVGVESTNSASSTPTKGAHSE